MPHDLSEGSEELLESVSFNAYSRVSNCHHNPAIMNLGLDSNISHFGVFDSIGDQIDQDLLCPVSI